MKLDLPGTDGSHCCGGGKRIQPAGRGNGESLGVVSIDGRRVSTHSLHKAGGGVN